jgi:hypothetical protein
MDGALAAFTAIVDAHRGKVLHYAGDSLLAAFGAAEASEDDAVQAVRCGLALLAESRRRAAAVPEFGIRVGVHTGDVLLGGGVDDEGTIRGLAVNIAARMEQSAPAGGLRISHDTYHHVRGIFDVVAQAPITVKGSSEPLVTYLVERARPRAFRVETRGIEGVPTLMIGREPELGRLQQAVRSLLEARCLRRVTIVGEAGIGKSRLLHEFVDWIESAPERVLLLQGRATSQTVARPYGLLFDVIGWHFGIGEGDPTGVAQRKLVAGVVPLLEAETGSGDAEAHAHMLGHLIGIDFSASHHIQGIVDDPLQIQSRGVHAAVRVLRRLAATGGAPLLLQLEDVHWADAESLDFIDHLADVGADIPLLVVALARPTLFERRPAPVTDRGAGERIDLAPLDDAVSNRLAGELLKKMADIPAALRERLTRSAEGNPFYMEELVKMLVDQGAIDTGGAEGAPWRLDATRLDTARLPTTLTGIVQARLDELGADERLALQQASVIGTVFWDRTLAALDPRAPRALASPVPTRSPETRAGRTARRRHGLRLPAPDRPAGDLRDAVAAGAPGAACGGCALVRGARRSESRRLPRHDGGAPRAGRRAYAGGRVLHPGGRTRARASCARRRRRAGDARPRGPRPCGRRTGGGPAGAALALARAFCA